MFASPDGATIWFDTNWAEHDPRRFEVQFKISGCLSSDLHAVAYSCLCRCLATRRKRGYALLAAP